MTVSVNEVIANGLNTRLSPLAMGSVYGNAGLAADPGVPSLALDFSQPLPSSVTFTRADASTCATYFDSNGVLRTAAANIPRIDYDPSTGVCKGLLIEEARTNLLLNSLADGTNLATQSVTTAATPYTLSFFGTGTVTLTGTSTAGPLTGTSATTKVSLTFTPTAGSLTLTVSGTVKWANLEAGSFATSHIVTDGSTRTRAADVCSMTGTNFSRWFNATEGTIVSEQSFGFVPSAVQYPASWSIGAGSNAESYQCYLTSTSAMIVEVRDGSVAQAALGRADPSPNKLAFAYKVNDLALSVDGSALSTDATATLPSPDRIQFGASAGGSTNLNGWVRGFRYFPKRLSDAQLKSLTL
jgi:hypothetical protein